MSAPQAGQGAPNAEDNGHHIGSPNIGPVSFDRGDREMPVEEELRRFEEAKIERGLGFASPVAGALVLANTLLGGSGMLGIPHALMVAGWALGLALILVFGALSAFGSHLLYCAARRIGTAPCSFYSVASAVAPSWTWLIDGAVMVKCFGVGTSYLIIVGDLAPPAMRFLGLHGAERWHAILVAFCVGGAMAYARSLNALRYTALFSVMIVTWTALLILLFFLRPGDAFEPCTSRSPSAVAAAWAALPASERLFLPSGPVLELLDGGGEASEPQLLQGGPVLELLARGSQALPCHGAEFRPVAIEGFLKLGKALPVFIFGFTCQQNVFTICNEVREASRRRVDGMIVASYLFAGVAFTATAMLGYATYGDKVQPDVLTSYPNGGVVQCTRLLFATLATFSFPLQAHPSRASALALWSMARGPPAGPLSSQREYLADADAGIRRAERRRFLICTTVGLALSCALALSVKSLGLMLGVVGATGSTMVSYILPGLCYVMAFPKRSIVKVLAYCQLGLGCVIMPVCLLMVFL